MTTQLAPWHGGAHSETVAGLAAALARHDMEVTVVAPLESDASAARSGLARRLRPLEITVDGAISNVTIYDGALPAGGATVFLVEGGQRVGQLCAAALEIARVYDRWPAVLHAADEASAPVLRLAGDDGDRPRPLSVASVHGSRPPAAAADADVFVALSPQHARDMIAAGVVTRDKLHGILSGIDTSRWNPRRDSALAAAFDARDPSGKTACKRALQHEVRLPRRPGVPLIAIVSDLAPETAAAIAALDAQLLIAGTSSEAAATARALAHRRPTRVAVLAHTDSAVLHRVLAGADFKLDPGKLGANARHPLTCWRYGTIPIISADSGLSDTVIDFDHRTGTGNAFVFAERSPQAIATAVQRALRAYKTPAMQPLAQRAMAFDLSWATTARRYAELYTATSR